MRQEMVDQSVQQIWEQQDSLGQLLTGLQEALRPSPQQQAEEAAAMATWTSGSAQPMSSGVLPPVRNHQRAQALAMQLDLLDRQAEELAKETGQVQSSLYKEPLTTVVKVLDAHANALDAIQSQVSSVTQRISAIETAL